MAIVPEAALKAPIHVTIIVYSHRNRKSICICVGVIVLPKVVDFISTGFEVHRNKS